MMIGLGGLGGGAVLALPACLSAPVAGQKASQYAMHVLELLFHGNGGGDVHRAHAARSRSGFRHARAACPVGPDAVGGLTAIILGTALLVRWRQRHAAAETLPRELDRWVGWAVGFMFLAELAGTVALYTLWDAARDPVFEATRLPVMGGIATSRVLFSAFHAVSAFCSGGLSLCRNDLAAYSWRWQVYGVILPLMVLGSIGVIPLHQLFARLAGRGHSQAKGCRDLWATLIVLAAGGGLIYGIESTRRMQLRYPREAMPGRLQLAEQPGGSGVGAQNPTAHRLIQLSPRRRVSNRSSSRRPRGSGFKLVRLDENSISPATRCVLMLLMFVGGAVGGTAGGIRLVTAWTALRDGFKRGPRRFEFLSSGSLMLEDPPDENSGASTGAGVREPAEAGLGDPPGLARR